MQIVRSIILLITIVAACLGLESPALYAQDKQGVYINVNVENGERLHEIRNDILSLQYHDSYNRTTALPLKIYNWKQEVVLQSTLEKTGGVNYYNIKLKELYAGWQPKQTYVCEIANERGDVYRIPFRILPSPEKTVEADIFVNPKYLKCDALEGNLVEFYGSVDGGKAPYRINWYILNNNRTALLYQPREQVINRAGSSAVISVDKNPDYYVILHVKDACGNEQYKVVHLVCEQGKKKVNTVFFETYKDLSNLKPIQ